MDVSKPAECRNYSLRCTLCPGFSVIRSRFSPSRPMSPVPAVAPLRSRASCTRARFLAASLPPSRLSSTLPPDTAATFCISPTQLRQSHLYALIPVHTDSGYLRESERERGTEGESAYRGRRLPSHNADDLCFFVCTASVASLRAAAGRVFLLSLFLFFLFFFFARGPTPRREI